MIGYVSIYIKAVGIKDTYYVKYESDFGKPITQDWLDMLVDSIKQTYAPYDKIVMTEFCSQEEYNREMEHQDSISMSWNDTEG